MTATRGVVARDQLFPGDSELSRLMRELDWSKTDLGDPGQWPEHWCTALRLCLTSRIPVVMYWGPNFTVLYNDAYISFLGETKHPRYLGRPGQECWSEIWDTIGPMLKGVYATGKATWSEDVLMFFARRLPREEVYVRFTFGPLLAADGRTVDGVFCPCTETTEQVVAARRLETLRKLGVKPTEARSVEAACRQAAEVLAENPYDIPMAAIYLADETGGRVKLCELSGLREREHPLPLDVSAPDTSPSPWRLTTVLQTHRTEEVSDLVETVGTELRGGPWDERTREALVLPIPAAAHGTVAGLLVVGVSARRFLDDAYRTFFDLVAAHLGTAIADAKAYEHERKRAEALAELDRAKTTFFSNVSHEFRTPLTLMLGPLEDILNRPSDSVFAENRELLTVVHRNAVRLLKLVNTLLDFSRLEAGRMQAAYEPTDLANATTDLVSAFRSAVERVGLRLIVDCPELPEPIYVDRDMWEKIVLNLVSNAFKFTFEGEIEVRLRPNGQRVELTVRDTGVGIPAEHLPRIFERFHRVAGARARNHEGTGIGLALVHDLVKLHGGTVAVSSTADVGTTFTVVLPIGSSHLPGDRIGGTRTLAPTAMGATPYLVEALRWLPEEVSETSLALPPSAVRRSERRVLIADDNADMRDYLRRLLSEYWTVEAVADGNAALAAVRATIPDLVLTDVMMPGLDGFELLKALRNDAATRTVPVILLSARAGEEARVEGLDAGADDYLVKPFSARELIARVNSHLEIARTRAEATQREQELRERLESILAGIREQFLTLDGDWRYTYVNDRVVDVTGLSRDRLLGQSVWDLFPEMRGTILEREARRAAAEKVPAHFEYLHAPWNRWFEVSVYPSSAGVSVFVGEITERKRAEEALVASDRAKDEFLAMLGHELRNPLGALASAVRILELEQRTPDHDARARGVIARQLGHLSRLVDDLLDISRVTSGKIHLDRRMLNMANVVMRAVEGLRSRGATARHQLTVETSPVWVNGDETRLEQVVSNLVGNALRYTPADGGISIRVRRDGGACVLAVEDNGIGVPSDMIDRIFDLFVQGQRPIDRAQGGLGIGLTLVRRLVELHGGTVEAKSEGSGKGTVFIARLPAADVGLETPTIAEPAVPHRRRRILLVEDNDDAREALSTALRLLGHEVHEVADGLSAIDAAISLDADVALIDIGLPRLDGYGVAQRLREKGLRTYLVALTGYGQSDDRRRAEVAGFDRHLVKPVDPAILDAVLSEVGERDS
jgi:PAS domain S-box-containing protein